MAEMPVPSDEENLLPSNETANSYIEPQQEIPLIEAHSIGFLRDGRWILKDIDFTIHKGEIVTLIGPNGGGKTTFARICLGILEAEKGTLVRQDDLTIGYVPQRLKLDRTLPLTVRRFLTVRHKVSSKDLMSALIEVGSSHLIDTQMSSLSGGEMQRVMLARALVNKPDLLVLDEPAQGVDFAGEAALYDLISKIRDRFGCAILLISHDLHIVMGSSDRVLCLNGHVCCAGVPEQISLHPEYERLFGPDRGQTYGIYAHSHDHSHALSGEELDPCCSHEHPSPETPETDPENSKDKP